MLLKIWMMWWPGRPTCREPRDSSCGTPSPRLDRFLVLIKQPILTMQALYSRGKGMPVHSSITSVVASSCYIPSSTGPTPGWMKSILVSPYRYFDRNDGEDQCEIAAAHSLTHWRSLVPQDVITVENSGELIRMKITDIPEPWQRIGGHYPTVVVHYLARHSWKPFSPE